MDVFVDLSRSNFNSRMYVKLSLSPPTTSPRYLINDNIFILSIEFIVKTQLVVSSLSSPPSRVPHACAIRDKRARAMSFLDKSHRSDKHIRQNQIHYYMMGPLEAMIASEIVCLVFAIEEVDCDKAHLKLETDVRVFRRIFFQIKYLRLN